MSEEKLSIPEIISIIDRILGLNYKLVLLYTIVALFVLVSVTFSIVQIIRLSRRHTKKKKEAEKFITDKIKASQNQNNKNSLLTDNSNDNEVYAPKGDNNLLYNYEFNKNLTAVIDKMKESKSKCILEDGEDLLNPVYDDYKAPTAA